MRRLSYLKLTTNQAGNTHQTRSQQAKSSWLWHHDVGVTARDLGRTVEESFASVNRQLHSDSTGVVPFKRPTQHARQSVVMCAIRESDQCPSYRAAEGAIEDNSIGHAVV